MFSLRYRIKKGHRIAVVGIGVAGSLVLATIGGFFEGLELAMLDQFFRLRAVPEVVVDDRILVVTIGEEDISAAGQWPISDATLAELVEQLNEHQPAVIGLDLYRNLPIEPGVEQLVEVFETTPNVIGVERVVGESVGAHNTLTQKGQTASSDVIVDSDRKIRRGLLSVITPSGEVRQGLASALALRYLSNFDIVPEALDSGGLSLQLGKGRVTRFDKNAGGYVDQDAGGFQVIMNYRGDYRQFESVSMTTVLDGGLTDEMVRDRVVLVGSTAISLNDLFHTPLHGDEQVAGVYIHAHLVSQLLWLALEGRPLLRTVPDAVEWLWTMLWVATSVVASRSVFYSKSLHSGVSPWQSVGRLLLIGGGLVTTGFGLLLWGWWLPMALPMVSILVAMALGIGYRNQQLQNLAAFDELTQVANRRYFDQYLETALKQHPYLSLILCDVDYFKAFNDLYGHPAGDRCLQQVAQAISLSIRESDLVARYGGEEFVVVLPSTTAETAAEIAARIQQHIRQAAIVHEGSQVSEWVTLSCGSASVSPGFSLPRLQLVQYADESLYEAKQSGRNQVVASQWQTREAKGASI